mmetsp:Transcript_56429/g.155953  ORF Transcript_56429/g.155953 Transcript_56429/m.155953 type:complete len:292 (+) Transcript_56429:553-1428(+)
MADFADATSSLPYDGGEAVVGGVILMELEKQNNDYESGLAEAAFYQSVANRCNADPSTCGGSKVVGLVASAPLEMGHDATIEYLTTLQAAAPNLVGIRQGLWVKDASFFYDEGFRGGLSALPAFNLPFDILVEHDQLSYTIDLATALPTVMFNLNHLGYPTITNATNWASWLDGINKLAALPNVYIKLSGLPQTYDAPGWTGESVVHHGGAQQSLRPNPNLNPSFHDPHRNLYRTPHRIPRPNPRPDRNRISADDFTPYVKAALDAFGAQRMNYAGIQTQIQTQTRTQTQT